MKLKSKTGKEYELVKQEKGWTLTRLDTGSVEKVSESMVEKTRGRLEAGEEIPFRKISYTVAIETAVVRILKGIIEVNKENKVYRHKNRCFYCEQVPCVCDTDNINERI